MSRSEEFVRGFLCVNFLFHLEAANSSAFQERPTDSGTEAAIGYVTWTDSHFLECRPQEDGSRAGLAGQPLAHRKTGQMAL